MKTLAHGSWPSFAVDPEPMAGEPLMKRDGARLLALEADIDLGPALSLYRWRQPTVSLGYAQRQERALDADRVAALGFPVVQRPTGGRAILHDHEWTYSVVAPIDHATLGGDLRRSFRRVAEVIREALAEIGIECLLADSRRPADRTPRSCQAGPACFTQARSFELTVGGRKLVGSAQRRLTRAYLQQGTILVGDGHERLAEVIRAENEEERHRLRRDLIESTTSVHRLVGGEASFGQFAVALERAWAVTAPAAPTAR